MFILGTSTNSQSPQDRALFEPILRLLAHRTIPLSLTILRTHYRPLDEHIPDRDAADRPIEPLGEIRELVNAIKLFAHQGGCIVHLGVYAEDELNEYGIFGTPHGALQRGLLSIAGAEAEMENLLVVPQTTGVWHHYAEFLATNKRVIGLLQVPGPRGLEGPPTPQYELPPLPRPRVPRLPPVGNFRT